MGKEVENLIIENNELLTTKYDFLKYIVNIKKFLYNFYAN